MVVWDLGMSAQLTGMQHESEYVLEGDLEGGGSWSGAGRKLGWELGKWGEETEGRQGGGGGRSWEGKRHGRGMGEDWERKREEREREGGSADG